MLARFLSVGALNTLAGLAVIYVLMWLGVSTAAANVGGYAVGLAISFVLNRAWTFRHRGRVASAAVRFLAAFAVAYGANLALVLLLTERLDLNRFFAQALGILPYTATMYLLSRHFVFRAVE